MKTIDELRGRKTRKTGTEMFNEYGPGWSETEVGTEWREAAAGFKPGDVKHTASFHEEGPSDIDKAVDPSHYMSDKGFQAIDVMQEATKEAKTGFMALLQGNAIKYLYRLWRKDNPLQDAKKARWYLDALIKELEKDEA